MIKEVLFDDFARIDIRVGTVTACVLNEKARKPAFKLIIDFGPLGVKTSSAQITDMYSPTEMVGRQVLAVVNFEPRKVADVKSEVLVIGVVGSKSGVVLLSVDLPVQNGTAVR